MDFPDSIISFFEGMMGQPKGGFPTELQKIVLKDREPITCRPGELLESEDFDAIRKHIQEDLHFEGTDQEVLGYAMYPSVFDDYAKAKEAGETFRYMGSDIFFHGLRQGETCEVKIKEGKVLIIRLVEASEPDEEGFRNVTFEVDGVRNVVRIKDKDGGAVSAAAAISYADENDPAEIGAPIPGNIVKILVKEGDEVSEGDPIAIMEAMKMETNILAGMSGTVETICVKEGQQVKAGELVARIE